MQFNMQMLLGLASCSFMHWSACLV